MNLTINHTANINTSYYYNITSTRRIKPPKPSNTVTMAPKTIFLIGPGFIGREILDRLPTEDYEVTVLAHRESLATDLQKAGFKTRAGALDDPEIITDQTFHSDIVIHCATADHLPSVEAVLAGLEKRASEGKTTTYIHTSGTGVLGDNSKGDFKSEKIYHDDKPEDINALPDSAPHRVIDLAIIKARKALGNKAKIAIMLPPTIYGFNPKFGRHSIQMPTLIRFALKHGHAGHIGKGEAVWNQVHIFDLARAYIVLLRWLEKSSPDDVLQNPYFFCENGIEFTWGEAAAEIGKQLYAAGKLESAESKTIPEQEWDDLFGEFSHMVVGSNSRNRANRLRELGWSPREKDMFQSLVEDEIPVILKEA